MTRPLAILIAIIALSAVIIIALFAPKKALEKQEEIRPTGFNLEKFKTALPPEMVGPEVEYFAE